MSDSADVFQVEGDFEMAVVHYLITSQTFALHFLPVIKDELFSTPQAELAVGLFIKYFKAKNKFPGGYTGASNIIVQWCNKGKITRSAKEACLTYLVEVELSASITEEECLSQFAEVVRAWRHHEALKKALDLAMQRRPITEIVEEVLAADALLKKKESQHVVGSISDVSTWTNIIKKSGTLDRLPTGIKEWDHAMKGGLARKHLGVIVGSTGAGKSTVLTQLCGSALLRGVNCAYISLEDDDATVAARIFAPIAGVPLTLAIQCADALEPYITKTCRRLKTVPGTLYVEEFPEGVTFAECVAQLDKKFDQHEFKPDVYFFDYALRFGGGTKRVENLYQRGMDAIQEMRNYVRSKEAWGWTAAQLKRVSSRDATKDSDENSVGGSIAIAQICDVMVMLQMTGRGTGNEEIRASFSKNRGAKRDVTTQWVPADYTYGTVFESDDFHLYSLERLKKDRAFSDYIELMPK